MIGAIIKQLSLKVTQMIQTNDDATLMKITEERNKHVNKTARLSIAV